MKVATKLALVVIFFVFPSAVLIPIGWAIGDELAYQTGSFIFHRFGL